MKPTQFLALATLLTLAYATLSTPAAAVTNLTAHDKRAILAEPFKTLKTTTEIPTTVRAEMVKLNNNYDFDMAEPGQPFQATDVVTQKLPARRLIFAAASNNYCVVHYEQGGIAHFNTVVVFRLGNHKAVLADRFPVKYTVTDMAALKQTRKAID